MGKRIELLDLTQDFTKKIWAVAMNLEELDSNEAHRELTKIGAEHVRLIEALYEGVL